MRLHLLPWTATARRGFACVLVVSNLCACAVDGTSASLAIAAPAPVPRVVQRDLGPEAVAAPAASAPLSR